MILFVLILPFKVQPVLKTEGNEQRAEPLCPVHGPQMEKMEITQGDVLLGYLWMCKAEGCNECYDEDEVKDAAPSPTPPQIQIANLERGEMQAGV